MACSWSGTWSWEEQEVTRHSGEQAGRGSGGAERREGYQGGPQEQPEAVLGEAGAAVHAVGKPQGGGHRVESTGLPSL